MNKRRHISAGHHRVSLMLSASLAIVLLLVMSEVAASWTAANLDQQPQRASSPEIALTTAPITMVFQKLVSPSASYVGVADTFIDMYNPNVAAGGSQTMKVTSAMGARERCLIKFDLSLIPTGATVTQASLELFAWYRSTSDLGSALITAYQVKRPWTEIAATWNKATTVIAWGMPGCNDPVGDYSPTTAVTTSLRWVNGTYSWDITHMVQQWVANPLTNEGVVLLGTGQPVQYQFRTSEASGPTQRPLLRVTFTTDVISPTPSLTPLVSPSPTSTPTSTRTATPIYSPTITHTPTETMTPTVTPSRTPTPTPVVRIFQQGVAPDELYAGASDTCISSYWPDWVLHGEDSLRISQRSRGAERMLMRFDLGEHIPANAQITSARLSLFAWSRRTLLGMRISAFRINRGWEATSATWNQASLGQVWGAPGCDQISTDRQGDSLDSRFVYFIDQDYEWDMTSSVQAWIADPASNHGILLIADEVDQDVRFRSSQWRVLTQRPKLTVTYTLP